MQEVDIGPFRNRSADFRLADRMAPNGPISPDSTWHHHEDGRTLQEVDKNIHRNFTHRGGISGMRKDRRLLNMTISEFGAVPISDVKMLENKYNIKLPKDYFDFLCSVGGGVIGKSDNRIYVKGISDIISIDVLFGINTQYKNANIDRWMDKYLDEMPEDTLIIGDTLEHGFIVLLCSGENAGVYYWDDTYHFACSNDENNTFFIGDTFKDFVKGPL
jgi:hypothetical protein